jgi:hypothetical protein
METIIQPSSNTEDSQGLPAQQAQIEAVISSLRTLFEDDEQEQQETFEYLKQSLDEDRPSHRKLFPPT